MVVSPKESVCVPLIVSAALAAALLLVGCEDENSATGCQRDSDCSSVETCAGGACVRNEWTANTGDDDVPVDDDSPSCSSDIL